jgi:hypothetical protein
MTYRFTYLAGWLVFADDGESLRMTHKIWCDSESSAQALAAMYNRVLAT